MVPCVGLQFGIMFFPDHTHLLFVALTYSCLHTYKESIQANVVCTMIWHIYYIKDLT